MGVNSNDHYGSAGYERGSVIDRAEHGAAGDIETGRRLKYVQDVPLKTIVDEASATVTYIGEAVQGTATNSALWRIQRITQSGTTTTIEFTNGNDKFESVWDNRASLSYS